MIAALQALFITLATSIPARVLTSLGLGFITFEGFTGVIDQLTTQTMQYWNGIPADLYNLLSLGGFTDALGITLASLTTRAAITAIPFIGKHP
jgi:hypothetical protein